MYLKRAQVGVAGVGGQLVNKTFDQCDFPVSKNAAGDAHRCRNPYEQEAGAGGGAFKIPYNIKVFYQHGSSII